VILHTFSSTREDQTSRLQHYQKKLKPKRKARKSMAIAQPPILRPAVVYKDQRARKKKRKKLHIFMSLIE
jgi:hypothetical protein